MIETSPGLLFSPDRKRGLRAAVAFFCAALLQTSVRGDSLSYTNSFVYSNVPAFSTSSGGSDGQFSGQNVFAMGSSVGAGFTQFNSELGHLDSVDWSLTLSGHSESHFSYYPWFGSPGYGTVAEQLTLLSVRLGSFSTPDKYLSTSAGTPSVQGNFTIPLLGSADGNLSLPVLINVQMSNASLLDALIDETSFYMDCQTRYSYSASYATGSGSLPDFQIALSYTYNFTPVPAPEPSAIGLFGISGVLFLLLRRANSS